MKKKFIDLRSDTVTLPTKEMLEAITNTELGDDVYEEDPTVNKLEGLAAEKLGKEAALLVTSGTQANLVSILSNTNHGNAIILGSDSHIYWYEVGGLSAIGGLMPLTIKEHYGVLDPEDIEKKIRPRDIHFPETTMVCIENTHNRAGGTIVSPKQIKAISDVVKSHGLTLYMDGARIFNAAVAMKIDVKKFTEHVDNLMFCLSKGLSCPIGSIIIGSQIFIDRARKYRKILGGGMRQAGIIAAPGIIALEKMIDRLDDDHKNARFLAENLNKIEGIYVDLNLVQTNIVNVNIKDLKITSEQFCSRLKEKGILTLERDQFNVRMVTHRGIKREHIEKTLTIIEKITK